jgi:ubiquinone/menaquinone biosynthesis C-methylase UbiE
MSWQHTLIDRYYRSRPGWTDGTQDFHALCRRYITASSRVLEIGPGAGGQTSEFLTQIAGRVEGLDVDPSALSNPHLSKVHVYDGHRFPLPDNSLDCVVSDYALEHVERPSELLKEIHRVLAPQGCFIFRTPNALHYVSLLSRVFPDRLSVWARNRAPDHAVYRKFFRCNSEGSCRGQLQDAGFAVLELSMIEKEPSYGLRSRLLFFPMMGYERLVNSSDIFRVLRANILCAARRTSP